MTSREKKAAVIRQVIKPALKAAGFSGVKSTQTLFARYNECNIAVNIRSSRFNNDAGGFNFWLCFVVTDQPVTEERLRDATYFNEGFSEACFLPNQGRLHPLRNVLGYVIDGYRDRVPQDMPYEEIQAILSNDMQRHIIPGLSKFNSMADYRREAERWKAEASSLLVRLADYFSTAHMLALPFQDGGRMGFVNMDIAEYQNWMGSVNMNRLVEHQNEKGITAEEILKNESIYERVRALSPFPRDNIWPLICMTLSK